MPKSPRVRYLQLQSYRYRVAILMLVGLATLLAEPRGQTVGTDALSYARGFLITGNYVVGSVDLPKEGGVGTINVGAAYSNAVPAGADIVGAYLYWETITTLTSMPVATFRGTTIGEAKVTTVNALPDSSGASCWGASGNATSKLIMYRADVLGLLPKQMDVDGAWTGRYVVNNEDLQAQQLPLHTVTLPQAGTGNVLIQSAGATLLLVYRDPAEPLRKIVVYDGAHTAGTPLEQRIGGIYASAADAQSRMTHLVGYGGGNAPSERILLNNQVLASAPFAKPSDGADRAWATITVNATTAMPGLDSGDGFGEIATTRVEPTDSSNHCLAWSAVIFSTAVADVDHDGLPDALEDASAGMLDPATSAFPYGQPLPNLNAMRAGSDQKDLFVEINAMWAAAGTTYGSVNAPYNATTAAVTDTAGHSHLPAPEVLKMVGDTYARNGIRPHFDVGDVTAYFAEDGHACDIGEVVCDARQYLVPSEQARGGELIKERACDPASGITCQFPDYPGTVGWKLGVQLQKDAPVGDDGEELTKDEVQLWGSATAPQAIDARTHRRRFDRDRSNFFHYLLYAHARGKPKSDLPCLDQSGNPSTYDITTPSNSCTRNNPLFHVPSSTSGIADLPGNTAMITLGLWDNFTGGTFIQASTTLHELGHNLNLWHGGAVAIWGDATNPTRIEPNCKPNYLSSMSYLFQAHGLVDGNGDLRIDYSSTEYAAINEGNAADGLLVPTPNYVPYWFAPANSALAAILGGSPATRFCSGMRFGSSAPAPMVRVHGSSPSSAIDWDGDPATIASVGQDVNFDRTSDGTLTGHDDWTNLRLDQIGAGRQIRIHSSASGDFLDFGSGDFLDFGSGDFLDFGSGDFLDFGSGTYYVNFASGDFLDFGAGDFLDFGSGDFLDFGSGLLMPDAAGVVDPASGDFLDFGSGDFLDFGSGDFLDFGSGDFLDFGSGDFLDFGSGDFLDFGAGDFLDFGAGLGGQELDYDLARALGRTPPRKLEACVLGATCTGTQPAPGAPLYHRNSLRWQAPVVGKVFEYRVYRVTGAAVTATSTRVLVGTTASTNYVDSEELPNGVAFTYFVTAEFDEGTPRPTSGASNFATITAVNDAPIAVADSYGTSQGSPLTIDAAGVLGNDTDTDSLSRHVAVPVASGPANGSLSLNADGSFTYTPNAGFYGTDAFSYRANNGNWGGTAVPLSADSALATVTITVTQVVVPPSNQAPVCPVLDASVVTGSATTLTHNCTDPDGDALTVTAVGRATLGTTALLADGRFTYSVASPKVGADSFTYSVTDGKTSVTATVAMRAIYGFVNVDNLPPANGRSFSRGGTAPLKWRWTNAAGVALDTALAQPFVMAYACSVGGKLPPAYPMGPFTLSQPGSGNSFVMATKKNSFTWQFNWKLSYSVVEASGQVKTYDLPAGTYVVSVGSGLTGQTDPTTTHNCSDGRTLRGALLTIK